jgi:hypothetical protein
METDASKRIWKFTKHKLTDKLLFLALAQYANGEGTCFPSYDTLASMVGVNRRSAIRIVEKLAQSGELFYKPTVGRGNTNLYFVTVGLSSGEVKRVLTTQYEMTGDEAQAVIDELLAKGVIYDIKSVTDNTISDEKTVSPITPLIVKGVTHNTRSKESSSPESKPDKESKILSPKQIMFLALAEICRIDLKVSTDKQRGQLDQAAIALSKTVADVGLFKSKFNIYWTKIDWRGKQGQAPSPAQVREIYGDYCHWLESGEGIPVYAQKNGTHKAIETPLNPESAAFGVAWRSKVRPRPPKQE